MNPDDHQAALLQTLRERLEQAIGAPPQDDLVEFVHRSIKAGANLEDIISAFVKGLRQFALAGESFAIACHNAAVAAKECSRAMNALCEHSQPNPRNNTKFYDRFYTPRKRQ